MGMFSRDEIPDEFDGVVSPVDVDVEREKRGYEVLEDKIIKCADCGIKLVEIIMVQDSKETKRVTAECPCGGSSFIYEVKGKTFIQPVEGRALADMPMDIKDGVMYITVKVV